MVLSRCTCTHRCSVGFQEKLRDGRYGKKPEGSCGERGCPGQPAWDRSCERCWPAPSRATQAWAWLGRGSENGQPPWWNKVALPKTDWRDSSLQDDEMPHWEERGIVTPWAGKLAVKGYYQNIYSVQLVCWFCGIHIAIILKVFSWAGKLLENFSLLYSISSNIQHRIILAYKKTTCLATECSRDTDVMVVLRAHKEG